jgi:hypothetical protein
MWNIIEGFSIIEQSNKIIINEGSIQSQSNASVFKNIPSTKFIKMEGLSYIQINPTGNIYVSKFRNIQDTLVHTLIIENGSLVMNLSNADYTFSDDFFVGVITDYLNAGVGTGTSTTGSTGTDINNTITSKINITGSTIPLPIEAVLVSTIHVDNMGDLKTGWTYKKGDSEIKLDSSSLSGKDVYITYTI